MLRANARRLTELADAIETVGAREAFYGETGVSRFQNLRQPNLRGLRLTDLELRHRGHTSRPFLRVPRFRLEPGEWACILGPSGCGKSALLKAIDGLWPYGAGTVEMGADDQLMLAGQDPDIPERMTLKALTAYPDAEEAFADAHVVECLEHVGLDQFVPELHEELHKGLSWRRVLSGGQQERLVLARILLQRPNILLLDEATAALDPGAVIEFNRMLMRSLPDEAVLAVHHSATPPVSPNGQPLFQSILEIRDGLALQRPSGQTLVTVAGV